MSTTSEEKPVMGGFLRPASATAGVLTILDYSTPEAPELYISESSVNEGMGSGYAYSTIDEALEVLRKHLPEVEGVARICVTQEDYIIHVWIIIEREDWQIRERIYGIQYQIYLSEPLAFRFNFHVTEDRELTGCMPVF